MFNKVIFRKVIIINILVLILLLLIIKPIGFNGVLLLVLFQIFYIIKQYLKTHGHEIAFDLGFVFGVCAAYYSGIILEFIIFLLSIYNRYSFKDYKTRHISKIFRHVPLFVIVYFLRFYKFTYVAILVLSINYAIKYIYLTIKKKVAEKSFYHVINFSLSIIFFYVIDYVFRLI